MAATYITTTAYKRLITWQLAVMGTVTSCQDHVNWMNLRAGPMPGQHQLPFTKDIGYHPVDTTTNLTTVMNT